jgi:hypothetical protein
MHLRDRTRRTNFVFQWRIKEAPNVNFIKALRALRVRYTSVHQRLSKSCIKE